MRKTFVMLALALAMGAGAKTSVPRGGVKISPELIGIFFEDISQSADGGLSAELIQNGSFEVDAFSHEGAFTSWSLERRGHSLGRADVLRERPLHPNNPQYVRLTVERAREYYDNKALRGVGLTNAGYDGITLREGAQYHFSLFARNVKGAAKQLRVMLVKPGRPEQVLAETTLEATASDWQELKATLTPSASCPDARLRLLCLTEGLVDVDCLSLLPADTYKGHGLRTDLVEALRELHPAFMRFPGGCVVHGGGNGFWNTYRWKETIGPRHERRQQANPWGYHQTMALGYYEYFQLCEDLAMQPLPILPVGVSCQGAGGGWGMKGQAQDVCDMRDIDEWAQDALDLIEWANGDATTPWGARRAAQGHPEPFHLKYLGLGNEEKISPEFAERFRYIYNKVRERYPDIVVVGTAGPGSHKGNPDYDNGWKLAEELAVPVLDEHYYEPRDYFLNNQHNYDAYPRTRTTKVYLGEYAAKDKKLQDALYEALYLTGVERNGDVVAMTSYAPLFCKRGHTNWNPDLIYFDNERVVLTPSYYVQQMFGLSAGHYYYNNVARADNADKYNATSAVLNTERHELYIKLVNAATEARTFHIDLSGFRFTSKTAQTLMLTGQMDAENTFEAQPLAPTAGTLPLKKKMTVEAPAASVQLITVKL